MVVGVRRPCARHWPPTVADVDARRVRAAREARRRRSGRGSCRRRASARRSGRSRRGPPPPRPCSMRKSARCQPLWPAMKCAGPQASRVALRKAIPSSGRHAVSSTCASAWVAQASFGLSASASRAVSSARAEFARLLESERVGAENEARQRMAAIPRRQHARDRIADRQRLAEEEIGVLGEAQRERVGRPVGEDRLPGERGVDRPAFGPRLDGGDMQLFRGPRRRQARAPPRRSRRRPRDGRRGSRRSGTARRSPRRRERRTGSAASACFRTPTGSPVRPQ